MRIERSVLRDNVDLSLRVLEVTGDWDYGRVTEDGLGKSQYQM